MQEFQDRFVSDSSPYPHWILEPFSREFLLKLKAEMLALPREFKETDLFRLNQTVDFANVQESHQLSELKRVLYSQAFRSHVERITRCGELNTVMRWRSV